MIRVSAWALVAIGVLHLAMFTYEARGLIPGWAAGGLWTDDHWLPFLEQPPLLAANLNAYWATMGGFAIPLMMLGFLLLWMDARAIRPPAFVGWGVLAWAALNAAIIEVSGFPAVIPMAIGLILGARKPPGGQRAEAGR